MSGRSELSRFELGNRGRVPFALVGVVLLVASAMFTGAITPDRPTPEPAVDRVVERTTADARAAFRTAVSEASVAAAAAPVLTNASTSWGGVVGGDRPFVNALKVRIYVAARERLRSVGRTSRGVRGNASLASTPTPGALKRAIRRVAIAERGPDETGIRAEIENITVTATDDGRIVGRRNVTLSVAVPTPVLEAHDRVEAFESRLNAGLSDPGLTQRLSGRLYAVAWARGYAQYGGAPISNVVANRHVELMTNGALLEIQESAFGRSDLDGRDAMTRATASVGLRDALPAVDSVVPAVPKVIEERLRLASRPSESDAIPQVAGPGGRGSGPAPRANETTEIPVGIAADRAFAVTVLGRPSAPSNRSTPLNRSVESVYSADVKTVTATETVRGGKPRWPDPPEGTRGLERNESGPEVVAVENATTGPPVRTPEGYHRLRTADRAVTLRHRRTLRVERNGTVESVNATETERVRVRIGFSGNHSTSRFAPDAPIEPVHERGGPLDGPNLANLSRRAERVLDGAGGPKGLARAAALVGADNHTSWADLGVQPTVTGARPPGLRRWLRTDLIGFRERIRNLSVSVRRGNLGTYEARPARRLAERIRGNRSRLADVPNSYAGVAEKARVAVRNRFLDVVLSRLERRASERAGTSEEIRDRLDDEDSPVSFDTVQDSYDAAQAAGTAPSPDGDVTFRVDGAPPYLSTLALDADDAPSIQGDETVYPLVAENVNFATIPYADVVDGLLTELLGDAQEPTTKLRTAGQALATANRTAAAGSSAVSLGNRSALRADIQAEIYGDPGSPGDAFGLVDILGLVVEEYGVDDGRPVVVDALEEWDSVHARALALANGSVVDPLVALAARNANGTLDSRADREELRVTLRGTLYNTLDTEGSNVEAAAATAVAKELKSAVKDRLTERIDRTVGKRFGRSVSRLPAGVPITPIPGSWWATAGIWSVKVRGEYHRFAVETRRRTPDADDPSLSYVRDGRNVTLDVDADGTEEVLGTADRVSFAAETGVVVVVPPGGAGVGDVDGNMVEESPGWPHAGPVSERPEGCTEREGEREDEREDTLGMIGIWTDPILDTCERSTQP